MIIRKIKIEGLFKYLNYDINLKQDFNILHSINGKGKTTILNVLTNILNGELSRLYQLSFKKIRLDFTEDDYVEIYREIHKKKSIIFFTYKIDGKLMSEKNVRNTNSVNAFKRKIQLNPLLLPAQRVSLNETYQTNMNELYQYRYHMERLERKADFYSPDYQMTKLFSLKKEIIETVRRISISSSNMLSTIDNRLLEQFFNESVFTIDNDNKIDKDKMLEKIEYIKELKANYPTEHKKFFKQNDLVKRIEKQLFSLKESNSNVSRFLDLYIKNIESKQKIINKYISPFSDFENIINSFFEDKKIKISIYNKLNDIFKITSEAGDLLEIKQLSSGEKNLMLIFFHFLFKIKANTIFMIDEPELSLHIDWQSEIINNFKKYSNGNQVIIVTHSPDIIQHHRNYEIKLEDCRF